MERARSAGYHCAMLHPDPALLAALRQGLFVSLCVGLAFSALWGLWLVVSPVMAQRFAKGADRWVTSDAFLERLNQPLGHPRFFYRHHRLAGILIAAGAAWCLWRWAVAYNRAGVISSLDRHIVSYGLDWMVAAIEWSYVGANALILVFGLVVTVRPSLLKTPERWADRWVRVPAVGNTLDRRYHPLENAVESHPRLLGGLVALASGFLLWRLVGT